MTTALILVTIVVKRINKIIKLKSRLKSKSKECRRALKFPPCFPSIPVVGSMPFLPKFSNLHEFFTENADRYGPVVAIHFANEYVVMLIGKEAIQDAFVQKGSDFAGRPKFKFDEFLKKTRKGIIVRQYDDDFRLYHKLTINILRKFGFGSKIMENRIHDEMNSFIKELQTLSGEPLCPKLLLFQHVLNVITGLLLGKKFEPEDVDRDAVVDLIRRSFAEFKELVVVNFFPFLRFVPKKHNTALGGNISNPTTTVTTNKNENTETNGENKNGVSDGEEKIGDSKVKKEEENYDREQLILTLNDLFKAGTETTVSTLEWAFIMMASYQHVQDRCYQDIEKVTGRRRMPSLSDKSHMPYVEATIYEIMRYKPVTPLAIPHCTTKDTEVLGYFIPAGTTVFGNLYSALKGAKTWGDPDVFRPERFLSEDGSSVINKEAVINFSVGKRSCTGEILARHEVFLFLTCTLQRFQIVPSSVEENSDQIPTLPKPFQKSSQAENNQVRYEQVMDVSLKPADYKIRFIDRIQ
ncbi:hypothetical protein HELRODRAFT_72098 [Helobdella robusta]|uniref:Uncharacterized protein n=1 Tax=Helobdella robusta TaxID=6412 RepID=T1G0V6_HELRO|nr:hypothetical protein HELRODRAFT_72098 [Helobdella robusta]ESO10713.1 hypothetical protein HELRODRAFT_72098 [Helobdella robusta]